MARATNAPASRNRRRRVVKAAKGFRGNRSKLYRYAKDAVRKAKQYSYRDRKNRKRTFRQLWITRVRAALTECDVTYSRFVADMKAANIDLDRKVLADIAATEPAAFKALVQSVRG